MQESVHRIILDYADRHSISCEDADTYFTELYEGAAGASAVNQIGKEALNEVLNDYHLLAVRMYTSSRKLRG
eukprot:843540-Pleurochrysis_carterae.AAC.1